MLFLVGSLVFGVDAVRQRDATTAAASAMFVVGVLAFLIAERMPHRCSDCRRPLPAGSEPGELCDKCRARQARRLARATGERRIQVIALEPGDRRTPARNRRLAGRLHRAGSV
jgi:hypothetical protein